MWARGLDGSWGGDPSFEVLKRGNLHLVVTEVVPVRGGADQHRKVLVLISISVSEGLRRVWSSVLLVCL